MGKQIRLIHEIYKGYGIFVNYSINYLINKLAKRFIFKLAIPNNYKKIFNQKAKQEMR